MFDLVNGIPLHPLVVHAVVVLLPLATIGTIAIAVRPRWRTRYGPLVVAAALVAAALCPLATSSGEALEKRVGDPGNHAALGDTLVWFAIPLVLLSAALVWLQRRDERSLAPDGPGDSVSSAPRTATRVAAALCIVAALASTVQVYRVGDSGARAAWGDVPAATGGG